MKYFKEDNDNIRSNKGTDKELIMLWKVGSAKKDRNKIINKMNKCSCKRRK